MKDNLQERIKNKKFLKDFQKACGAGDLKVFNLLYPDVLKHKARVYIWESGFFEAIAYHQPSIMRKMLTLELEHKVCPVENSLLFQGLNKSMTFQYSNSTNFLLKQSVIPFEGELDKREENLNAFDLFFLSVGQEDFEAARYIRAVWEEKNKQSILAPYRLSGPFQEWKSYDTESLIFLIHEFKATPSTPGIPELLQKLTTNPKKLKAVENALQIQAEETLLRANLNTKENNALPKNVFKL